MVSLIAVDWKIFSVALMEDGGRGSNKASECSAGNAKDDSTASKIWIVLLSVDSKSGASFGVSPNLCAEWS